jgi:sugar/nucleoside kinase (ribokinase family)
VDAEYVVGDFPQPNQKVSALEQILTAGGPAANAAITFSFLGGAASLVTAIGQHALAAIALEDLEKHGVVLHDVAADPAAPPSLSSICVHARTGERTIVSANAAAQAAAPDRFDPKVLSGVEILLVDGHHMPLCIAAARAASEAGITVVLDGGSWKEGMPGLLPYVDIAICSEDFTPPVELRDQGIVKIAITRGAKPILWSTPQSAGELAVRAVEPRDTSGAGDIFHGAFCWAYASGSEFTKALEFASELATESCLHYGTRSWMKLRNKQRSSDVPHRPG